MAQDSKLTLISGDLPQADDSKETPEDLVSLKQDDGISVHGGTSVSSGEKQKELHDSKLTLISDGVPQADDSKETPKDLVSLKQDDGVSVHSGISVSSGEKEHKLHDSKLTLVSGRLPQADDSKEIPKDLVSLKQDDSMSVHSGPSGEKDHELHAVESSEETRIKWNIPPVLVVPAPSLQTLSSDDSFQSLEKESDNSVEKVLGETILNEAELEASKLMKEEASRAASEADSPDNLHSLMNCRICQLFVRTVDRLLDKSEEAMDHYMPLTEDEISSLKQVVEEIDTSQGPEDHQKTACLNRIAALSSRLRQRAYMMALSKLRLARRSTHSNLSQLQMTIDLIERAQQEAEPEFRKSHEQLNAMCSRWSQQRRSLDDLPSYKKEEVLAAISGEVEAGVPLTADRSAVEVGVPQDDKTREPGTSAPAASRSTMETGAPSAKDHAGDEVESKTLEMSRLLTLDLQGTYENLLANLKDVPLHLKDKLHESYQHMAELHARFTTAHSFADLPGSLLERGLWIMAQAQESMDEVMEFAFQNPMSLWGNDRPPVPGTTATPSAQREEGDILKIQAAYEPKECDEKYK